MNRRPMKRDEGIGITVRHTPTDTIGVVVKTGRNVPEDEVNVMDLTGRVTTVRQRDLRVVFDPRTVT